MRVRLVNANCPMMCDADQALTFEDFAQITRDLAAIPLV